MSVESRHNSQTEALSFRSNIVYVILIIALAVLILTWLLLRRFTLIWINRPITFIESIIAGIAAWTFIFSIIMWFAGMVLTIIDFSSTNDILDIWMIVFSVVLTGYGTNVIIQSRSEFGLDDTLDFLKEAIQFRRSAQTRLDLISLIRQRQKTRIRSVPGNDPVSLERARLQVNLNKGKELDIQLALLREGTPVDISDTWRTQTEKHSFHPFCEKVEEVRIEPNRKRFFVSVNFPELSEIQLKDEMIVLRFNRQVYDFFQSVNSESWLKPYSPLYESIFLMCRAKRINKDNMEILYPFLKAGILVSELRKLEGSYFNPRKLAEIATVAFNDGAQV
jgi:hypothetical protein